LGFQAEEHAKLLATEMDVLKRSCRKTRLNSMRREMEVDGNIIDKIQKRELIWFGHVNCTEEGRLPQRVFKWVLPRRRK
jgi:hypothetical protein